MRHAIVLTAALNSMSESGIHSRLRALIGQRFRYGGEVWVLHEVLGDEDAVVLLREQHVTDSPLQGNLYGQGVRRSQETLTLPLSGGDGEYYSSELHDLLAGRLLNPSS